MFADQVAQPYVVMETQNTKRLVYVRPRTISEISVVDIGPAELVDYTPEQGPVPEETGWLSGLLPQQELWNPRL
jgi:hypothetical protein